MPPPDENDPPYPSDGVFRRLLQQLGFSGTEKSQTPWEGLGLGKLDSGDLLLLVVLFLLLREGKAPKENEGSSAESEKKTGLSSNLVLLLALAAAFLLGDDGL